MTIEQPRRAAALGADAALVVTPPYVRPTQAGLVAHFRAVADDGELPVVLYNVPGRTGCDMLPETTAELAAHERIVGIKEARNDAERMQALLPLRGDGFAALSGHDPTAVRAMPAGSDGIVSVASTIVPSTLPTPAALARAGQAAHAQEPGARMGAVCHCLSRVSTPTQT